MTNSVLSLSHCQETALKSLLETDNNIFITGKAGTGKSFLIQQYLKQSLNPPPVLASTGAAAILVRGRTFHSFFGLGIMEGGIEKTVRRAVKNGKVRKQLAKSDEIIIDEISMIPGAAFQAAEHIARIVREDSRPWGGLRIIAVGDFAQLPPVARFGERTDWCFRNPCWQETGFQVHLLQTIFRTADAEFLDVLNTIRMGSFDEKVAQFLNSRKVIDEAAFASFKGTRLLPRKNAVAQYNQQRLQEIEGKIHSFATEYNGPQRFIDQLKRNAPIEEVVHLKVSALVMILRNDHWGRWVNGSLGYVRELDKNRMEIELLQGGIAELEPTVFELLDIEGKTVASAKNFAVTLAYASTIHKAQGMTVDRVLIDLRNLWESGQAYVALSRVREAKNLYIQDFTSNSFRIDAQVEAFHREISAQ